MDWNQNDEYEKTSPGVIKNKKTGELIMIDTVKDVTPRINRRVEFLGKHIFKVKNTQGLSQEKIAKIQNEAAIHYFHKEEVPDNVIAINTWEEDKD